MRRYVRKHDLSDGDRARLDFVISVFGPGMKEVSLCAARFRSRCRKETGKILRGGIKPMASDDANYDDISLVKDVDKLPGVIGGVGFGEFVGRWFVDGHVRAGVFAPPDGRIPRVPGEVCPVFDGVGLCDSSGSYRTYGGSGFTMLVDERRLDGVPEPRTWEDILDPMYRGKIVCGFNIDDINEIPLVYIYRRFGEDGLAAFADNLARPVDTLDMMRVWLRGGGMPSVAIYLVPHFFAVAAPHESYIREIWPDDGALFSPFYALVRRSYGQEGDDEDAEGNGLDAGDVPAERIAREFFFGRDLAHTLAGRRMFHVGQTVQDLLEGSFGPTFAELDLTSPSELRKALGWVESRRFCWVGWDWLLSRDIIETMKEIDSIVVPRILENNPDLEGDIGRALWNG